jgi:hypothetical protein
MAHDVSDLLLVAKSIFPLRMNACNFKMSVIFDFATSNTLGAYYSLALHKEHILNGSKSVFLSIDRVN